jgi:hypothetical protein
LSDQINVNSGGTRDSGSGGVLAAILIIALIAFLVWAFAFGGFATLSGRPVVAPATSSSPSGPNVDVKPNININVPSGSQSAPSGGQSAPSGGQPAPAKP